jgi:hypothetical protein
VVVGWGSVAGWAIANDVRVAVELLAWFHGMKWDGNRAIGRVRTWGWWCCVGFASSVLKIYNMLQQWTTKRPWRSGQQNDPDDTASVKRSNWNGVN